MGAIDDATANGRPTSRYEIYVKEESFDISYAGIGLNPFCCVSRDNGYWYDPTRGTLICQFFRP
jgi:hypothetical protein